MPRMNDATVPELVAQTGDLIWAVLIREFDLMRAGAEAAFGRVLLGALCLAMAAGLAVILVATLGVVGAIALMEHGMDPMMAALSVAGGFALLVIILTVCGLRAIRAARDIPARHMDRLRDEAVRVKEAL